MPPDLATVVALFRSKIEQHGLGNLTGTYVFIVDDESVVLRDDPGGYTLRMAPAPGDEICTIKLTCEILSSMLENRNPTRVVVRALTMRRLTVDPMPPAIQLAKALQSMAR